MIRTLIATVAKLNKATFYNGLLSGFFWCVQFSDLWRVKWFFDTLMQDNAVASWAMTVVIEAGMGLLSLDLLRRVTANAQRTWRTAKDGSRKQTGYKQPITLLVFSVLVLGTLESFISVAFFYEFGEITKLTDRLLGGDTLYTAIAFGVLGAVLTFVFSAVEGERTRIAEREREKAEAKAEAAQKRAEAKREKEKAEREEAESKQKEAEAKARIEQEKARAKLEQARIEQEIAEAKPYVCSRCGERFATKQALAGHLGGVARRKHNAEPQSSELSLDEQIALVIEADCPTQEQVWMLSLLNLDQAAIGDLLGVTPDYVVASLKEMPEDLNE